MNKTEVRLFYKRETGTAVEIDDPGEDIIDARERALRNIDDFLDENLPEEQSDSENTLVTYVAPAVYDKFRGELMSEMQSVKNRIKADLNGEKYSLCGVTEEYLEWLEDIAGKWLSTH